MSCLNSLSFYREQECALGQISSTTQDGSLLEYETLELRVHPPNVEIDNCSYSDRTVIIIDSANRPGTLVEVVQCLTEMGLGVRKARISSDGGWFVDEFHTDRITDCTKLQALRDVLSVNFEQNDTSAVVSEQIVFELAGSDQAGLLADVTSLLDNNGCDVQSLAVWTQNQRVAFVISVLLKKGNGSESYKPPCDLTGNTPLNGTLDSRVEAYFNLVKLQRLKELLAQMMDCKKEGKALVDVQRVKGLIHHERRLHQLLLREEAARWEMSKLREEYEQMVAKNNLTPYAPMGCAPKAQEGQPGRSCLWKMTFEEGCYDANGHPSPRTSVDKPINMASSVPERLAEDDVSPNHAWATALSLPSISTYAPNDNQVYKRAAVRTGNSLVSPKASKPEVRISHFKECKYWLVVIRCKDRKKLLFDTVCTLADLDYGIYHASVDTEGEWTEQQFYIRTRFGDSTWSVEKAAKLKYMLETSIQRRHPKGMKVHVQSWKDYDLASLTGAWRDAGLWITRAKASLGYKGSKGNTFYILDEAGTAPSIKAIQSACVSQGGRPILVNPSETLVTGVVPPLSREGPEPVNKPVALTSASEEGTSQVPSSQSENTQGEREEGARGCAFGFSVLKRSGSSGAASSIASST